MINPYGSRSRRPLPGRGVRRRVPNGMVPRRRMPARPMAPGGGAVGAPGVMNPFVGRMPRVGRRPMRGLYG